MEVNSTLRWRETKSDGRIFTCVQALTCWHGWTELLSILMCQLIICLFPWYVVSVFIRIHKFRLLGQGEGLSQDRTSYFPSPVWLSGTAWALSARWSARQTSPATPTFGSLTWRSSTKRLARGRSSVLGLPLNLEVWISRLFLRVATFSWGLALSGSSRKGSSLPAVYTSTRSH